MSSAVSDLSANIGQLLPKSGGREHPQPFDCGISNQQFPLSSEEELGMLDACLQQEDIGDKFVSQQS